METNLSGKSKIVPPKASEMSEIGLSYKGKQNESLEGDGEPTVKYPSSLNPFAPEYVAFSTPKNVQSMICPSEGSPFPNLQQPKLNRTPSLRIKRKLRRSKQAAMSWND